MSSKAAVCCFVMLLAGTGALARSIHYGAIVDDGVLRCDSLHWRGKNEQSIPCYRQIIAGANASAAKAEAAWALNDLKSANEFYRAAMAAVPGDAMTLTRWGDLFAASHQDAEAMTIYREALDIDPQFAFALLGAAKVLAGSFDEAANAYLEKLLANESADDGARAAAWLLVARIGIESGALDEARDALEKSAELIAANDWPPLEVYALRAAADLQDGVANESWTELALQYNPRYGAIYATPAYIYVITRRYREAIELYQRAVDIEPEFAAAHEELGVNLLRDNQVTRARKHLEIAHNIDPFGPIAVNTLRLLDSFVDFQLLTDPDSSEDNRELPLVLRLHKDEASAIAPYAIQLARDSIDVFSRRYRFDPAEPIVIEMYPDHEDFAVRTAGMPGIGILGATFGYVIAMDSPSSRPTDQFQWGTTLWHEMAHVFTLEATNHLVPRWFSEGVSVFEEWTSGPNPGVRIPMSVYNAIAAGKLLPIDDLDQGFIRPSYPEQVIVSYMQAGLVCQFVAERIGAEKLADMLEAFARGSSTRENITSVLGYTSERFDEAFADFVKQRHGQVLDNLERWQVLKTEIARQFANEDWDAVIASGLAMRAIHPGYVEPDSPYLMLAEAYERRGERREALAALAAFKAGGGYDPAALKRYSGWLLEAGDTQAAIDAMLAIMLVQPLDGSLHRELGELMLDDGNTEAALRELEIALAQDPHDKAVVFFRIAQAHSRIGNADEARRRVLQALDIAPAYRPAQKLLLELTRSASTPQTRNDNRED